MSSITNRSAPEIKSAPGYTSDVSNAFDDFMTAFDAFKQANDERLSQIETRMASDVITDEKVARISSVLDTQKKMLDNLVMKNARPSLAGNGAQIIAASERKAAFEAYMRSGDEREMRALESKSMSYGSGPDGGFLVPDETEREIGKRLAELSPIRSIASVRQVSGAVLKKPFSISGPAVGWVGETDPRTETAASTLAELQYPTMELYAMPAATASLLDDSAINIDSGSPAKSKRHSPSRKGPPL